MQKLRGYLALGTFIMGIASFLCLLLPLIEITDDALMLMMLAVPPLICGLIIAVALHMLLYTLLLVLYGCRIQVLDLYFLQYIRRKTVGWRVQYLPAAERKMSIVMEAVPWEKETGRQQERARTALFYVQTALAILFYALAVNLYGTASAIACPVLAWGYTFLGIIMPPSEIRKVFQPEKRRKMWQMQCLLAENLTDRLLTEMPEEYFTPPDKIQDQNDAALMIFRAADDAEPLRRGAGHPDHAGAGASGADEAPLVAADSARRSVRTGAGQAGLLPERV